MNKKNYICINVFCYENDLVYLVHISKQKFKDYIDLLLINDYIKDLYSTIQNVKMKHFFCRYCLQCFSSERIFMKHREICLEINSK